MIFRWLACSTFGILLITAGAPSTIAQAGPPCGPDLPNKCTPGKDAAIVLGFVGAGALAAYLGYRMNHPKREDSITGCTTQADGVMALMEQSTKTLYSLSPVHKRVKAGQRVVLRGKKNQDASGRNVFHVTKVVKDEGPCEAQSLSAGQKDTP